MTCELAFPLELSTRLRARVQPVGGLTVAVSGRTAIAATSTSPATTPAGVAIVRSVTPLSTPAWVAERNVAAAATYGWTGG